MLGGISPPQSPMPAIRATRTLGEGEQPAANVRLTSKAANEAAIVVGLGINTSRHHNANPCFVYAAGLAVPPQRAGKRRYRTAWAGWRGSTVWGTQIRRRSSLSHAAAFGLLLRPANGRSSPS